jgi:hypothetical protein
MSSEIFTSVTRNKNQNKRTEIVSAPSQQYERIITEIFLVAKRSRREGMYVDMKLPAFTKRFSVMTSLSPLPHLPKSG